MKNTYEPLFARSSGTDGTFVTVPECLHRECICCGYKWDSPTLDQMAQMTKFEVGGPLNQCFPEGQRPEIKPSFDERFPPKTPEWYGKQMQAAWEAKQKAAVEQAAKEGHQR